MRYETTLDGKLAEIEEHSEIYTKAMAIEALRVANLQLANHMEEKPRLEAAVMYAQALIAKCTELKIA